LGLGNIFVKDESKRLGVQAFKACGGTYAIAKLMCEKLEIDLNIANLPDLKSKITETLG